EGAVGDTAHRAQFEWLSRPLGRYEGLAFMFGGVAIVVLATTRFVRTTRLLDDPERHSASDVRAELILSAVLMLLVTTNSIYLALDGPGWHSAKSRAMVWASPTMGVGQRLAQAATVA